MAKTILITYLDRIEHEYDPTKVYFSFMISVLCKLADGDVTKNVNWDYMQPWKWKDSRVRFGCYDINSNLCVHACLKATKVRWGAGNGPSQATAYSTRGSIGIIPSSCPRRRKSSIERRPISPISWVYSFTYIATN